MNYKRYLYGGSLTVLLLLSSLTLAQTMISTVSFGEVNGRGGIFPDRPDILQINRVRVDTLIKPLFEAERTETVYYDLLFKACDFAGTVYLQPLLTAEEPACSSAAMDFGGSFIPEFGAEFDKVRFDNIRVDTDYRSITFKFDAIMLRLVQILNPPQQVVISLNWGEHPRDLDAHLTGPEPGAMGTYFNEPDRFHLYFANRCVFVESACMASLEVNEFSDGKPETVRIFPPVGMVTLRPGNYRFTVHHFVGIGDIASSNAEVRVWVGNEPERLFTPIPGNWIDDHYALPPGLAGEGQGDVWKVFELVITDDGSVIILPTEHYDTGFTEPGRVGMI